MFRFFKSSNKNKKSSPSHRRIRLESLEDRCLLAVMAGFETAAAPESTGMAIIVDTLNDILDSNDAVMSLREAIILANANEGSSITFDASLAGGTITLDTAFMNESSGYVSESDHKGALYLTAGMTIDGADLGITLSGQDKLSVFTINAASTSPISIQGLTITEGRNMWEGGGIFIQGASHVSFTDCIITNNAVIQESAIPCNCNGGGIAFDGNGTLIITDCEISNNTAQASIAGKVGWGGGIWNNGAKLTIVNSTISGNKAESLAGDAYGGGIGYYSGTDSSIDQSVISNNTVRGQNAFGGGFSTRKAKNLWVRSSVVSDNVTEAFGNMGSAYGGGFYSGNTQGVGGGAAIWFYDVTLSGNQATVSQAQYAKGIVNEAAGGGFYNNDNFVRMYYCSVLDNSATGALYNNGGGIFNINQLYIHDGIISGNTVGALNDSIDYSLGGGIHNASLYTVTFFNCAITDNAIYSANRNDFPCGGGIYNKSGILIYDSTIAGNTIQTSTGIESYGAGIYDEGAMTATGCVIVENSISAGTTTVASDAYSATAIETSALKLYMCLVNIAGNGYDNYPILYSYENTEGIVIESRRYTPGDVLFTDAASGDYTLAQNSVAIDKGDMATYDTYKGQLDYNDTNLYDLRGEGFFRVVNDIIDYGCYEYQTAPTPVTPLDAPLFEAGNVASYGANRHSATWGAVTNGVEYELAYVANDATDWTTIKTTELSVVVTNLTYGAQMAYKVRAIGDGVTYSDSEWSQTLLLNVCPMDLDGDGRIGPADRTLLASAWLARPSSSNWDVRADIDGNNTVASGDRTFLTSNYLKAVTATDLSYPPALAEAVFAEGVEVDDVDDFAVPTLDVDFDFFG